jgi:hypothetical protein
MITMTITSKIKIKMGHLLRARPLGTIACHA